METIGYLPSHNPNIPSQVRTPRPKNSATISADNPKLSMSEHKQNELINASTSTRIETSSSRDMNYDVTKVSQLQIDKHEQIERTPAPTTTSNLPIDHPSPLSDYRNQVQNNNLLSFEFWLPVREVLGYFIPTIPKKEHKRSNMV
jgi:hypothetical protein